MSTTVLITGGFGYVGSRLTPYLLSLGYKVRCLDLMLYGDDGLVSLQNDPHFKDWEKRFTFIKGDIRKAEDLEKALDTCDAVIHLAAISNDPTGEVDETLTRQVNFDAVGLLLTMSKKKGVKRFINASSSSVFGLKSEDNIDEKLEPEPLTLYSKYKMLAEWLVLSAHDKDFCTVNIRPATICGYSPRQRFDLTVNKLTADAIRKGVITVHGGHQRRPNIGMSDMIRFYAELLEIDKGLINGRTFNFGFENHKIIDIAHIIKDELKGRDVRIEVTDTLDKRDYHISSNKLVEALHYNPVSSIRQEVANLCKELETQFKDIDDKRHYNMKSMNLSRDHSAYHYFSL